MFDVHKFLFRFDWPFFWPVAGLTPETYNLRYYCLAGANFSGLSGIELSILWIVIYYQSRRSLSFDSSPSTIL